MTGPTRDQQHAAARLMLAQLGVVSLARVLVDDHGVVFIEAFTDADPTALPTSFEQLSVRWRQSDNSITQAHQPLDAVARQRLTPAQRDAYTIERCDVFQQEIGLSPTDYVDRWRIGAVEDTSENTRIAIRAMALSEALRRAAGE